MNLTEFVLPKISTPRWARGGHLQTLAAHFLSSESIQARPQQFLVHLEDGDQILCEDLVQNSSTLALLCHGLSGDSQSDYMQITGKALLEQGLHVILMNHRGVRTAHAQHPYHSGRAEDVSAVIGEVRRRYPHKKVVAIGFSMSGNIVSLNATGFRSTHLPDMAVAFNAPLDLAICSDRLGRGWNRIYDLRFGKRLRALIHDKSNAGLIQLPKRLPYICTCADIDELYTAPFGGFVDRADYYATCSGSKYLSSLQIPLWLITSEDDPFIDVNTYKSLQSHDRLRVDILPTGGHMGYLHSSGRKTERWLHHWATQFALKLKN